MTQHTDQGQPSGGLSFRRSLLSVLTLLLLTGLMFLIFQDHLPEIRQAIGKLSPAQLGLLLALALTYPLIEGVISQRVLASRVPGFSFRRGLDLAFLGAFGNVVTFGAGTLPMQGYDISLSGLPAVPGMGLMTLQYVFHKGAVMVYAVLLLALNGRWLLAADAAGMMRYLLPACLMVAAIILALVLVCTSRTVQRAAYWALGRLPDTGKWQARRQSWTRQLDGLAAESRSLLADRKLCIQMFLLQVAKLALMYAIVWLGTAFMDLGPPDVLAGPDPGRPDDAAVQRPAQRGGHGLGGSLLLSGVHRLSGAERRHVGAAAVPRGHLLLHLCGQLRGVLLHPKAVGQGQTGRRIKQKGGHPVGQTG